MLILGLTEKPHSTTQGELMSLKIKKNSHVPMIIQSFKSEHEFHELYTNFKG